jgi:hypothetical protein
MITTTLVDRDSELLFEPSIPIRGATAAWGR